MQLAPPIPCMKRNISRILRLSLSRQARVATQYREIPITSIHRLPNLSDKTPQNRWATAKPKKNALISCFISLLVASKTLVRIGNEGVRRSTEMDVKDINKASRHIIQRLSGCRRYLRIMLMTYAENFPMCPTRDLDRSIIQICEIGAKAQCIVCTEAYVLIFYSEMNCRE